MQRASEEQKAQHSLEQGLTEVHTLEHRAAIGPMLNPKCCKAMSASDAIRAMSITPKVVGSLMKLNNAVSMSSTAMIWNNS